jgi:hypothetical protein
VLLQRTHDLLEDLENEDVSQWLEESAEMFLNGSGCSSFGRN